MPSSARSARCVPGAPVHSTLNAKACLELEDNGIKFKSEEFSSFYAT